MRQKLCIPTNALTKFLIPLYGILSKITPPPVAAELATRKITKPNSLIAMSTKHTHRGVRVVHSCKITPPLVAAELAKGIYPTKYCHSYANKICTQRCEVIFQGSFSVMNTLKCAHSVINYIYTKTH